jgi:hypothetical protein
MRPVSPLTTPLSLALALSLCYRGLVQERTNSLRSHLVSASISPPDPHTSHGDGGVFMGRSSQTGTYPLFPPFLSLPFPSRFLSVSILPAPLDLVNWRTFSTNSSLNSSRVNRNRYLESNKASSNSIFVDFDQL